MGTFETSTVFQLPGLGDLRVPVVMRELGWLPLSEYRPTISLEALFREST
jgi:hypothetical protein